MATDEERRPTGGGAACKQVGETEASVAEWAAVYEDAQRWVIWTGRRRWPAFAVNDQIWACSVTDWATSGRRAA